MTASMRMLFEAPDVVRWHARRDALHPPERTILREIGPHLGRMRVLDIGVGAGRTTSFLSGAREYVGIDCSAPMIEACRLRYPNRRGLRFDVCDAVDMSRFADASFDFTMFSHAGLDCVEHDERMRALAEIRRVTRPGGLFAFSTHNLRVVDELLAPRANLLRYALLVALNQPKRTLLEREHAMVVDGAYRFRTRLYYVKPLEQLRQLADVGFGGVRAFDFRRGAELQPDALPASRETFLYFLCRR